MRRSLLLALALAFALPPSPPARADSEQDKILLLKKNRIEKGFEISLWASEPLIQNVVSFCFDRKMRAYVVETDRWASSTFDIRRCPPEWVPADLALQSVEERVAFLKRAMGDKFPSIDTEGERVRLVEDADGDGKAEKATTFADGFTGARSGTAAGILERDGNVWFTNIPDLWLLRDENGDGVADFRKSLQYGYGIHIGYLGHDLHGLVFGPDGKLYFSIGDRGFRVKQGDEELVRTSEGAVFRCNPDGSGLEIFYTGLRNPQELAFDDYGNLFTGDNNCDNGDPARWVYLVEGGYSGWNYKYQHQPGAGEWRSEPLYAGGKPDPKTGRRSAPHILPPVHEGPFHGPAGLVAYPGTGLPKEYDGSFFLCDYPGGIRNFKVRPKGASFEFVEHKEWCWDNRPCDVDFGLDGAIYFLDWVEGWDKTGMGRMYRIVHPESQKDPIVRQTEKLLREGAKGKPVDELIVRLHHPDRRVRYDAQYELASRPAESRDRVVHALENNDESLPVTTRLHLLWALGMIGDEEALTVVGAHLADPDPHVRAWAARIAGDRRLPDAALPVGLMLRDPDPHVRVQAAIALGKFRDRSSLPQLTAMLRENTDRDAVIRHAAVMGMAGLGDAAALAALAKNDSPAVRLGVLLALWRLKRPEVQGFLDDSDDIIQSEAARAILEAPIPAALPALAARLKDPKAPEGLQKMALRANGELKTPEAGATLLAFAGRRDAPETLRLEALIGLRAAKPSAGPDTERQVAALLEDPSFTVRKETLRLVADLGLASLAPQIHALFTDPFRGEPIHLGEIRYAYYEGDWERLPDFKKLKPLTSDGARGFDLTVAGRGDKFGFVFESPLEVAVPGRYTFTLRSDDGSRLLVDGKIVVENDGVHGPQEEKSGAVDLAAGRHELGVHYFERDGAQSLEIGYIFPDGGRKVFAWDRPTAFRIEALRTLEQLQAPQLREAVPAAVADEDLNLQIEGIRILFATRSDEAMGELDRLLKEAPVPVQQVVVRALGKMERHEADAAILSLLDRLAAGQLPAALRYDVVAAAEMKKHAGIGEKLAAYRAAKPADDPLSPWIELTAGGDPAAGRTIFFELGAADCKKCHKIGNDGGVVGPDLTQVGARLPPEMILDSILFPNHVIADGYRQEVIQTDDERFITGRVETETPEAVTLITPEGKRETVEKKRIAARKPSDSAMPADHAKKLKAEEIRNLVAFLTGLR